MHRQVHRAGWVALVGLGLAVGLTACQGGSADFVPPPTAPPTESPTPAPATTTAATNGAGELANATIAMPFRSGSLDEACPSTPLKYTDGGHQAKFTMARGGESFYVATIAAVARVDIDRDGTDELIAKAQCADADGENWKIFALRPDGKGGYATLGTVIGPNSGTGGDISAVGDLAVTSTGEVLVAVAARQYEPPWSPPLTWQHRAYAWTGQAFAQTGGPTTFTGDPAVASFTVTTQPVTLTDASGADRNGTISATVKALGPQATPASLIVWMHGIQPRSGGDWSRCQRTEPENTWTLCDLGTLAAGTQATITLPFRASAGPWLGYTDGDLRVQVREGVYEHEPMTIRVTNP